MRLVDFLILLLQAQAQTLQRLAALFGEENLVEILESAGDEPPGREEGLAAGGFPELARMRWLDEPAPGSGAFPYAELEGTVHELGLSAVLEFHLWAYPSYRSFIESPLDLNSRVRADAASVLIQETLAQAQAWVKKLPVAPEAGLRAERAAKVAWLKFRAEVLKRVGRRPLSAV